MFGTYGTCALIVLNEAVLLCGKHSPVSFATPGVGGGRWTCPVQDQEEDASNRLFLLPLQVWEVEGGPDPCKIRRRMRALGRPDGRLRPYCVLTVWIPVSRRPYTEGDSLLQAGRLNFSSPSTHTGAHLLPNPLTP
eukprot:364104-Chlamydomonas_euryale.AAC.3